LAGAKLALSLLLCRSLPSRADTEVVHALTTFATFRDRRDLSGDPLVDFEIRRIRILWSDQLPGTPAAAAAPTPATMSGASTPASCG
jgi:hypothetical protein